MYKTNELVALAEKFEKKAQQAQSKSDTLTPSTTAKVDVAVLASIRSLGEAAGKIKHTIDGLTWLGPKEVNQAIEAIRMIMPNLTDSWNNLNHGVATQVPLKPIGKFHR